MKSISVFFFIMFLMTYASKVTAELDRETVLKQELKKAIEKMDFKKAKMLIGMEASVAELSQSYKKTLMWLSSYNGDILVLSKLLENGMKIDEKLEHDWTALHYAIRLGHTELAQYLIDNNADLNVQTDEKMTPLMLAITQKRKDIEKLLVAKGVKTDAFCETIRGNKKAVEEFIKKDPNIVNELRGHFTLLHWAAYKGYPDIAKLLIDKGANVNSHSEYASPIYWAVRYNRPSIAKILVDNGADINLKMKDGVTVLHYASRSGIVEFLIKNGANVNAKTENDVIPLHMIVTKNGHNEALRSIIDYNDVLEEVHSKELIDKAVQEQLEVAKMLIENGADPLAKDAAGRTPYDYASDAGFEPNIEYLKKYNSKQ